MVFVPLFSAASSFLLVSASLVPLVSSFPVVALSGSRAPSPVVAAAASSFLVALARSSAFGGSLFVGCAAGVDRLGRSSFPAARASVFSVVRPPGGGALPRWAFAARSSRLVGACAAARGVLVAFPSSFSSCPSSLVPCSSWRGAGGSGSWGSVALALGLGCPVLLFVPSLVRSSSLPVAPALASRFSAVAVGVSPLGSWWFAPASFPSPVSVPSPAGQLSLF